MPKSDHYVMVPMDEYEKLTEVMVAGIEVTRLCARREGFQQVYDAVKRSAEGYRGARPSGGVESYSLAIVTGVKDTIDTLDAEIKAIKDAKP